MELMALRYCVATMQLGRVKAAAESFHVAPSAVSRAIRQVERELGVDLFDRVGRVLRPTSEGAVFLRDVATAVQSLDDAVRTTRQRAGVDQGVVRVGFLTSLGIMFQHPAVQLKPVQVSPGKRRDNFEPGTEEVSRYLWQ